MPHVNSSGGDDLASTDEVKVYKDEGEEEKRSSENLSEDKLGLVTESEEGKSSDIEGRSSFQDDKASGPTQNAKGPENPFLSERLGLLGCPMITPYPFHNGATTVGPLGGSKVLPSPPGLSPFYMYNNDHFSPPPAHMGIPPVHIDPKTGFTRPMYSLHGSQFPTTLYPELSQWTGPPHSYPLTATGLRGPYPTLSSSPLSRFSPPGILPHPGLPHLPHPAIITPGPKQELGAILNSESHRHNYFSHHHHDVHSHQNGPPSPEPKSKIPRIKKPLNAFMLFMKEMRQQVIEECTLKESAAINQILGRRWHALDRSEQAKYYEMARKEKELHQQLYPGWSARDNYATHNKKAIAKQQKRKRELGNGESKGWGNEDNSENWDDDCPNAKKCRARFGLDQQTQWCKPCRRKKKCIRFMEDGGMNSNGEDDDDDDDPIPSVGTTHSTTEGELSEQGSPAPSSTTQPEDIKPPPPPHQHPEVSQSGLPSPSSSKAPPLSLDMGLGVPPVLPPGSHPGFLPSGVQYPPLPPLYRPVPLRDGMLPPHHHHHHATLREGMLPPHPSPSLREHARLPPHTSIPLQPSPGTSSHSLPPSSVSSSTMVLAT